MQGSRARDLTGSLHLAAWFLAAFVIPVIIGAASFRLLYQESSDAYSRDELDVLFSSAPSIAGKGSYLKIKNSGVLNPQAGEDFLLVAWFKLIRALPLEERQLLLAKFESATPARSGYALALTSDKSGSVRPEVYWRDSAGRGRWYAFEELSALPAGWFMLALSFRDGRSLGLHVWPVERNGKPKVKILGGHQFDQEVLPRNDEDLLIGAFQSGELRGKVGPIGIFAMRNLSEHMEASLKEFTESPLDIPPDLSGKPTRLWCIDGAQDLSDFAHAVESVGLPEAKREKRAQGARKD